MEKIVEITPPSVYMEGSPGDALEAVVNITPAEKYPFSILAMTHKMDTHIRARLIEPTGKTKSWQIKVEGTSDKPDTLYDVLTLETDSRHKPKLTIRVYAVFNKKQNPKP